MEIKETKKLELMDVTAIIAELQDLKLSLVITF